ncbi:hypothetical protein J4E05_20945 [Thalassospira sp. NFXS8]|uniref:hypothetical protein n=1 Tax=Thalassospira sp. NFXS8 TaxID=2819093 RepID=UPI0032DF7077
MSLALKIGLALLLVFGAAIAMTTGLNYLRFDQTLHHLLSQRMTVVLSETRRDIVAGLDLGLRLENMENLDAILGRRLDMSEGIRNIQVFACDGSQIDVAQAGSVAPPPFSLPDMDQWQSFDHDRAIMGTLLRDSVGQCAGYVRIITDISDANAQLDHVLSRMWQAAMISLGTIVPVLLVLFVLMRRRHRVFVELNDDLERALDGKASAVSAHDGDVLTGGEMRMISLYRQLRDQLSRENANAETRHDDGLIDGDDQSGDGQKHEK